MSKFEGQMLQFKEDMTDRMDRIENKLDRNIENNRRESVIISSVTGVFIAVLGYFTGKN